MAPPFLQEKFKSAFIHFFASIMHHSVLSSPIHVSLLGHCVSTSLSHCVSGGVSVSFERGADSTVMWMIEAGRVNSASSSECVCVCAEECSPTVGLQARDRTGGGAGFRCRPKLHQLGNNTV